MANFQQSAFAIVKGSKAKSRFDILAFRMEEEAPGVPNDDGVNDESDELRKFYTERARTGLPSGRAPLDPEFTNDAFDSSTIESNEVFKEFYYGEERHALAEYDDWVASDTITGLKLRIEQSKVLMDNKVLAKSGFNAVLLSLRKVKAYKGDETLLADNKIRRPYCSDHPGAVSKGLMQNLNKYLGTDKRRDFGYQLTNPDFDDESAMVGQQRRVNAEKNQRPERWIHSHLFMTDRYKLNMSGVLFNFYLARRLEVHVLEPGVFNAHKDHDDRAGTSPYWLEERGMRYLFERPVDMNCFTATETRKEEKGMSKCRCCSNIKELLLSKYYNDERVCGPVYRPKGSGDPVEPVEFTETFANIPALVKTELIRPIVLLAAAIANMNKNVMVDQRDIHRLLLQSNFVSMHMKDCRNHTAKLFTVIVPEHLRSHPDLGGLVGEIRFCLGLLREFAGAFSSINEHRLTKFLGAGFSADTISEVKKPEGRRQYLAYLDRLDEALDKGAKDNMKATMKSALKVHYTHDIYYAKDMQQYVFLAIVAEMKEQLHSHPRHLPTKRSVFEKLNTMFFGVERERNENGRRYDLRSTVAVKPRTTYGYNWNTFEKEWRVARSNFGDHSHLVVAHHGASFFPNRRCQRSPGAGHIPYQGNENDGFKNVVLLNKDGAAHQGFQINGSVRDGPVHQIDTGVFATGIPPPVLHALKGEIRRRTHSIPIARRATEMEKGFSDNCHVGSWDLGADLSQPLRDKVRIAIASLHRDANPDASHWDIEMVQCRYSMGAPNFELMAVETPHYNGATREDRSFYVDVFVPCSESGCFLRLFPQLTKNDCRDHHGINVFTGRDSMLVMAGTMLRSGGMFTSMDGNPTLHLVYRAKPAAPTRTTHTGSKRARSSSEASSDSGHDFNEEMDPSVQNSNPLWQFVLPKGEVIGQEAATQARQQRVSIIPSIPKPQDDDGDKDDKLYWFLNKRFLHFWESLCV